MAEGVETAAAEHMDAAQAVRAAQPCAHGVMTREQAGAMGERMAALLCEKGARERGDLLRMYAKHPSIAVANLRALGIELGTDDVARLMPVAPMPALAPLALSVMILEGAYGEGGLPGRGGKPMITARLSVTEHALREAVRGRSILSDREVYMRGLETVRAELEG